MWQRPSRIWSSRTTTVPSRPERNETAPPREGAGGQRLRACSHQIAQVARLPHHDAFDRAVLDMAPAEGGQRNARHPDVVALRSPQGCGRAGNRRRTEANDRLEARMPLEQGQRLAARDVLGVVAGPHLGETDVRVFRREAGLEPGDPRVLVGGGEGGGDGGDRPFPPRMRPISKQRAWATDSGVACTTVKSRASAWASESQVRTLIPRARASLSTGVRRELLSTLTARTGSPSFVHASTSAAWRAASAFAGPSQRSSNPISAAASWAPFRQSSKYGFRVLFGMTPTVRVKSGASLRLYRAAWASGLRR